MSIKARTVHYTIPQVNYRGLETNGTTVMESSDGEAMKRVHL